MNSTLKALDSGALQATIDSWPRTQGSAVSLAQFIAKYAPRGKSSLPRMIGRKLFPDSRGCIRMESGALLAIDPLYLDIYTTILLEERRWNPHVLRTCLEFLKPGDVFFDIGASAGMMSIEVASKMKGEVQIHAFEPQARLAERLCISAAMNGFSDLSVYPISLGREQGELTLYLPKHSVHASFVSREDDAEEVVCPVEKLDDLFAGSELPAPKVIKIDVEGAELDVLSGAIELLKVAKPVVVFESDENMNRFGYSRKELVQLFAQVGGYTFSYVGEEGLIPADSDIADLAYADVAAIPIER